MVMMACGGGVELDACLSWLALTVTPVSRHGCWRDCANLVRRTRFFKTPLRRLEARNLTAPMAQAIYNQQTFCRAEKGVDTIRRFGCSGELQRAGIPSESAADLRSAEFQICVALGS
jgi:hypothetical protein